MVELHITCGTQNGNTTYRECEFKQQEPDLTTKQWSLSLSIEYGSKFGKQAGRDFGTILTRSVAFSWRAWWKRSTRYFTWFLRFALWHLLTCFDYCCTRTCESCNVAPFGLQHCYDKPWKGIDTDSALQQWKAWQVSECWFKVAFICPYLSYLGMHISHKEFQLYNILVDIPSDNWIVWCSIYIYIRVCIYIRVYIYTFIYVFSHGPFIRCISYCCLWSMDIYRWSSP